MDDALTNLMKECVVKLTTREQSGTGFFVGPGWILTCAHVLEKRQSEAKGYYEKDIAVRWKRQENFAQASVDKDSFFPKQDLALLHFETDHSLQLPCVLLGEKLQSDDKLMTYGYPDHSQEPDPITFDYEGPAGDEFPKVKFKLGNISPGLSGAPVLNRRTGRVCAMVAEKLNGGELLGGYGVPTETFFTHLPKLKGIQDHFHEQDHRWYEAMGRFDRIDSPDDLRKVVCKEIEDILEHNKVLTKRLGHILEEKGCGRLGTAEEIANRLTTIDIAELKILPWLSIAHKKASVDMQRQGRQDNAIQNMAAPATLDIVGWLVLLTVNMAWFSENPKKMHPEKFPYSIELPVKTDAGIEIIHAALNKRCARFGYNNGELYGRDRIAEYIPDGGIHPEDNVTELKRSIYKYIFKGFGKKSVPVRFTPDLNEELNSQLQWWNEMNETRYLVIDKRKSDSFDSLISRKVYEKIMTDLPDLKIIFQETAEGNPVFQVSEINLRTRLINFFK